MADTLTDNFESYDTGELLGQTGGDPSGEWTDVSGGSAIDVVTTGTPHTGNQHIRVNTATTAVLTHILADGATSGNIVVWMKAVSIAEDTNSIVILLRNSTNGPAAVMGLQRTAEDVYQSTYQATGGSVTAINTGLSASTYYRFEAKWDASANTTNFRQGTSDGSPGSWVGDQATSAFTSIKYIRLQYAGSAGTTEVYWDDISDPPIVTTDIKSINGLAIADVKSVNGLAIADVKSLNNLE